MQELDKTSSLVNKCHLLLFQIIVFQTLITYLVYLAFFSTSSVLRMGAHDRVEGSPAHSSEQRFKLLKIIKHSSYNKPAQMSHDIALLKLERLATLDE